MAEFGVTVRGYTNLQRLFAKAGPEAKKDLRDRLKELAEPTREDAERLAETRISRIGDEWGKMRVGVTTKVTYVAPVQRGVKGRGDLKRRRPKFATLMEQRAMIPALNENRDGIIQGVRGLFDALARKWTKE